jgi:hypothetical protein
MPFTQSLEVLEAPPTTEFCNLQQLLHYMHYFYIFKSYTVKDFFLV